jgi:hypothetical protein
MANESWAHARRAAEGQDWLLTADQAYCCGVLPSELAARVRSSECRPILRGVYLLNPDLYDQLPQRVLWRAALLAHGPTAMLVAGTGARALGVAGMRSEERIVEVALSDAVPRHPRLVEALHDPRDAVIEVVVRQIPVASDEVVLCDGLPVRAARFTVVDAALDVDRMSALALLDSSLHKGLVSPEELAASIAAAKGRPGIQQLRPLAQLADGRAESPLESRVRLACVDGDLPPDDLQHEVHNSRGWLVAIGDLGWFKRRRRPLLAEADGKAPHALPEPVYRDRRRGNSLVSELCDTVRFVWEDTLRPAYIQSVVRAALAAE